MGHPQPVLDRARVEETLVTMLDHVLPACPQVEYRLVGTGAALLLGVDLPAADVDLLVKEREDVDRIGAALTPFTCLSTPAWLPEARQYYASYEVDGVEVEISTVEIASNSDAIETYGPGPWERFVLVPCGSHRVSTVALELRLITELARDRPDRYEPILDTMLGAYKQAHGFDVMFLLRGMGAAGLPQAVQDRVLKRISQGQ